MAYYAILDGQTVFVRKSVRKPSVSICTLRIPKLPNSPTYNEDGSLNRGTVMYQKVFSGGELVGTIP